MKTNPQLLTELLSNKMIWTDTTQSKKKESGPIAENNSNGKKSILFALLHHAYTTPPPLVMLIASVHCLQYLTLHNGTWGALWQVQRQATFTHTGNHFS